MFFESQVRNFETRIKNKACLVFNLELYDLLHNSYSSILLHSPRLIITHMLMDVALNGFLSQLTDDVKNEKEKEPEKPEKPEILSFKKKGFELERKDSDDSDEVS